MPLNSASSKVALGSANAPLTPRLRAQTWVIIAVLAAVLLWVYWPTLTRMAERWASDPQYSHGFLVPIFALVVLWFRKLPLPQNSLDANEEWSPCWWGLPLLLLGVAARLAAGLMDIDPLDAYSLLPTLFGLVLLVGGRAVLRWSWPALAFLAFMLPLPFQLEEALAFPLRRLATLASTYVLQTLGYPAVAEGNIILIDQIRLGVVEACSGLGMLMTFFALATAMALVVKAPLVDRIVLVVSAVPIALVANVVRITATAIAYDSFGAELGQVIFHDLAGWFMMPLALGLLWLELWFLSKLLVARTPEKASPLPVYLSEPRS
ncbi:MAG: exosortase/archaeosortase family protein [Gemmataceae bacterium]|nr:exosortase/archaeosortase family protein [Gemmataceae bacterium]MCI0739266.1 exosortase/archaeosortase family protein [Gemmataceae bacterium]